MIASFFLAIKPSANFWKAKVRYIFDQFAVDTDRFELSENGEAIHAEPQVIELLIFFIRNRGRLITRDDLIQAVWKGRIVSDSAISGRIKVARKILGDDGKQQKYIQTVHKKGFSFTADELKEDAAITEQKASTPASRRVNTHAALGGQNIDPGPSIGVLKFTNPGQDIDQNATGK